MNGRVLIVGAGIAGLACAQELQDHHRDFLVLEASNKAGGRIQTDEVSGYRLDRGFQVLQTGYPELSAFLNLENLNLQKFPSGVAVRYGESFSIIADPRVHPMNIGSTIGTPVGTVMDKFRLLKLVHRVSSMPFEKLFEEKEKPTIDYLRRLRFSERFINSFFLPFFAGACLEKKLTASSRVLNYLVRIFATGDAMLPLLGMAEIPQQLVKKMSPDSIRYNSRVTEIYGNVLKLESGDCLEADEIVVATEEHSLGRLIASAKVRKSVGETCMYFGTDWTPPHNDPFLIINGDENGPVNNLAFPSMVSSHYAPEGKTLIAAIVLDQEVRHRDDLEALVRGQCRSWYGAAVDTWEHIRSYQIDHALPQQSPPTGSPYKKPQYLWPHVQICGEYQVLPGLQWSLISGRLAAQNIIEANIS